MQRHYGTPLVVIGSKIWMGDAAAMVDQTPVEVAQALADSDGLVEFTQHGASSYIDRSVITAITPTWGEPS